MQDYHKLLVWERAMEFVKLVYRLTRHFPREELYGLTSQLRRAVVSVVANIVEGRGKSTDKDFLRFLYISKGSLNECQCFFEIAKELEFINDEQFNYIENKRGEVGYLLYKFMNTLK
jgi:four helix bundle protein